MTYDYKPDGPVSAALASAFSLHIFLRTPMLHFVTAQTFANEMAEAMRTYERYIVCIDKTPEEFQTALLSLLNKAIKAFESRGPQLRHGIALDRHVTIILSQNDTPRPLCGIYFNLHSPYQKLSSPKAAHPLSETLSGGTEGKPL